MIMHLPVLESPGRSRPRTQTRSKELPLDTILEGDCIDQINIYWARMLAMTRAVEALGFEPAWILVDGNATPRWQRPSKAVIAGDSKCRSIAAASIVAKVTRDRIMAEHAETYPGYGWETNRGYPTPEHIRALDALGLTPLHRRSFAPVRERMGHVMVLPAE